jgi:hypothetical protein
MVSALMANIVLIFLISFVLPVPVSARRGVPEK